MRSLLTFGLLSTVVLLNFVGDALALSVSVSPNPVAPGGTLQVSLKASNLLQDIIGGLVSVNLLKNGNNIGNPLNNVQLGASTVVQFPISPTLSPGDYTIKINGAVKGGIEPTISFSVSLGAASGGTTNNGNSGSTGNNNGNGGTNSGDNSGSGGSGGSSGSDSGGSPPINSGGGGGGGGGIISSGGGDGGAGSGGSSAGGGTSGVNDGGSSGVNNHNNSGSSGNDSGGDSSSGDTSTSGGPGSSNPSPLPPLGGNSTVLPVSPSVGSTVSPTNLPNLGSEGPALGNSSIPGISTGSKPDEPGLVNVANSPLISGTPTAASARASMGGNSGSYITNSQGSLVFQPGGLGSATQVSKTSLGNASNTPSPSFSLPPGEGLKSNAHLKPAIIAAIVIIILLLITIISIYIIVRRNRARNRRVHRHLSYIFATPHAQNSSQTLVDPFSDNNHARKDSISDSRSLPGYPESETSSFSQEKVEVDALAYGFEPKRVEQLYKQRHRMRKLISAFKFRGKGIEEPQWEVI